MTDKHPTPLTPFNGDVIPAELKQHNRWAPWRAVWNAKREKYDKIPHRADTPKYGISTAKPDQWFSYDVALAAFEANPALFAGVGYVMTGPHGVVGTDLDHCVTDGVVAPWAAEVVAALASYTEVSPSGTGLRVFSLGELPADWCNHETGIEVYGGNEARFLTATGAHLAGTPLAINPAPDGVLKTLESRYAKERRRAEVIDLNMPDVIDDLLLPSIANLDIPYRARDFLETGSHRGDRSRELYATTVALYAAGLPDDEVFSLLACNEHAMDIALDHRRHDHDRALLYIWREQCCKGKAKAAGSMRLTADDFDVIEPVAVRDLSPIKEARFRVQSAMEFSQRVPMHWIVKGVLPAATLCVIYGASGSGKTFFTLDLVGAIARGIEWRGKKVRQSKVVYVCAEDVDGVRDRMAAYARYNGINPADIQLGVIPDAPNLLEKGDVKDLLLALRAFGQVDVIVIDTLAQSMPGGNENAGDDMGRVLAHCKAIHKATSALVILVHHSGKDSSKGARGWSGLRGAADTQIEVVRAGDDRAAVIDKQKNGGGEGTEFGFKLIPVVIGLDEDMEETTSCVLEYTLAVPKAERKKEPGDVEMIVLRTAQTLLGLSDDPFSAHELTEATICQLPHSDEKGKRDTRKQRVQRAIESLVSSARLDTSGGGVRVL